MREPAAPGPGRFDLPMSEDEARAALARLRAARPDLVAARPPRGFRRGFDAYSAESFPGVWQRACNNFHEAHGRFPDLDALPTTADHFFALKFFRPVPVNPVPADKLAAPLFLPPGLRAAVGYPRRLWVSDRPRLPADDAVPPGRYWLKLSNGNNAQFRLDWPIPPERRAEIEATVARWLVNPYGVRWGEWWYALVRPRLYLEADIGPLMDGQAEIKIFVREGRVKLLYGVRLHKGGRNEQTYFDPGLRPLEGRSPQNRPLEGPLPPTIGLMLRAAEEIGRRVPFARVDFLNARGPKPCLGEISLCHNNARRVLSPPEFDAWARRELFE